MSKDYCLIRLSDVTVIMGKQYEIMLLSHHSVGLLLHMNSMPQAVNDSM